MSASTALALNSTTAIAVAVAIVGFAAFWSNPRRTVNGGFFALSLLVALWAILLATSVGWWLGFGGSIIAPIVLLTTAGMTCCAVFAAWAKYGRIMLPFSALVMAPVYILWKVPIYLKLLIAREKKWVRTERAAEKKG